MTIELLDVVMLEQGLPEHGLKRGDIGAVVERYDDGDVEVEFVTVGGRTQALLALSPLQLSPLDSKDVLAVRRRH